MKQSLVGRRLEEIVPGAPTGLLVDPDRSLTSAPIRVGDTSEIVIRGRADMLVKGDDGSLGVVDLKTASVNDALVSTYGRQLHAYGVALEYPAKGRSNKLGPMGLVAFAPATFMPSGADAVLAGGLGWTEVPRDEVAFGEFLKELGAILDCPLPPDPGLGCQWCSDQSLR